VTLVDWWRTENNLAQLSEDEVKRQLYGRLLASLGDNGAERLVFGSYYRRFQGRDAAQQSALLPQVYLHYDPMTRRERAGRPSPLSRERMDFLLLLPGGVRIVIEVDGRQHYAEGDRASPRLYAEMMAEDRALRLKGYDVYRFGGSELGRPDAPTMVSKFFDDLEARYGLGQGNEAV
jgi:very-short-patch-repair endonuclease